MKFAHNFFQGRAITMDCQDYITELVERKKGQHLQREERGAIQHLKNAGYANRAIARAIGCSPTTVGNELKRGTPPRKSSKGRKPGYPARRGEAAYKANRKRSRKPHRICHCTRFIRWIYGTGQRTQVVFGCLCLICSPAQAVFSRGDGLHTHALQ